MHNPVDDMHPHNQLLDQPATTENGFLAMLTRAKARGMDPRTIIDVGASNGSWSRMAHEVWPEANLLIIEANPVFHVALLKFADEVPRVALCGSLCSGADAVSERVRFADDNPFQGIYPDPSGGYFPCTCIDAQVSRHRLDGPYLIKLDVHGREHEILAGAREALKNTVGLVVEVYTWSQGSNSMRAAELVPHIEREHGFLPADLCEPLRRPLDGRLVQVDMLFEPETAELMDTARYR